MAAIITDQFRISNANNFLDSVNNDQNSYYIFLSLPNPTTPSLGFGRNSNWDTSPDEPVDNINYLNHTKDGIICGKKITYVNARPVIKKRPWTVNTVYEMYRHDYSVSNPSPVTNSNRLYDASYYVINSNYSVYVCIDNGSNGDNVKGNPSLDEPLFTDLEVSKAGESGDGYIWKYLFTVSPSDIIKFDSTEYICVPNSWSTSTDPQIEAIRKNGDSSLNENQLKKIYINKKGQGYTLDGTVEVDILGDGTGGKVLITGNGNNITNAVVSSGGKNYTYGVVDLGAYNEVVTGSSNYAQLIPIIPPSKGHGYDIYNELGTDKVLLYARFDDSTRDFPENTTFAQVGIIKNPTIYGQTGIFSGSSFNGVRALKIAAISGTDLRTLNPGDVITQTISSTQVAKGYVVSYDPKTRVLKYYKDRNLCFDSSQYDNETDYRLVSTGAKVVDFIRTGGTITGSNGFTGTIENFTGSQVLDSSSNIIDLGTYFTEGISNPEINKNSGEIIYISNRPVVTRNIRQKEDVKITLEF
jgi:hypothetical protein